MTDRTSVVPNARGATRSAAGVRGWAGVRGKRPLLLGRRRAYGWLARSIAPSSWDPAAERHCNDATTVDWTPHSCDILADIHNNTAVHSTYFQLDSSTFIMASRHRRIPPLSGYSALLLNSTFIRANTRFDHNTREPFHFSPCSRAPQKTSTSVLALHCCQIGCLK